MGQNRFDKHMTAVTFAEAGDHDTARQIMAEADLPEENKAKLNNKKPVLQAVVFDALSLSAYVLLFMNEDLVTNTFTMGGWHAVFPVGAAFLFSFVHGAFASNFLSVLGLEAKK